MECLAIVRALRFAGECGFCSIILDGDFETVHKALSCEDVSFFSCNFVTYSKPFRRVKHVSDLSVWMEDILLHLLSVTLADFD